MAPAQLARYHALQARGGPWGNLTDAECDEWLALLLHVYADEWTISQAAHVASYFEDFFTIRSPREAVAS